VHEAVFKKIDSTSLRAYAVWEPILRTDDVSSARKATTMLPDPRVLHYWTDMQNVGEIFQPALSLRGAPAWDVYLVYPPGVEWKSKMPPSPGYFMHQLHQLPAERYLDADTLAVRIQGMLSLRDE
jgi:hypothetical protein